MPIGWREKCTIQSYTASSVQASQPTNSGTCASRRGRYNRDSHLASDSPFAAASDKATGEPLAVGMLFGLDKYRLNYRSATRLIAIWEHSVAKWRTIRGGPCCACEMPWAMCELPLRTTLQHSVADWRPQQRLETLDSEPIRCPEYLFTRSQRLAVDMAQGEALSRKPARNRRTLHLSECHTVGA